MTNRPCDKVRAVAHYVDVLRTMTLFRRLKSNIGRVTHIQLRRYGYGSDTLGHCLSEQEDVI